MLKVSGSTGTIGRHLPSSTKPIFIDLYNPNEFLRRPLFDPKDNFLHLAGVVGDKKVKNDLKYSLEVNVTGTLSVATKFLDESSGVFCFTSTSHVYAKSLERVDESGPIHPVSEYAKQKFEAELKLAELFQETPWRLSIVRVFSILDWDVPDWTLGGAVRRLARGKEVAELQNCDDVRDFLTPRKAAQALYLIASEGKISGVINLCSAQEISVGDAARRMLEESNFLVPRQKLVAGNSEHPYLVGENRRLRSFYPNLNLDWDPSRMN